MRPVDVIALCRDSHRAFLGSLAGLTDDDLRLPSLLPGYSRAHVLTHLINKAEAHSWVFGGPPADEVRHLHPDGYDTDVAAGAGAHRSILDLRSDLERSLDTLESAWDALDDELWDRKAVMTTGPRTMTEVIGHHLRNVEVHHVDLDVGYSPADWPSRFVEAELSKRLRSLPDRADHRSLLAWLLDRAPAPDLGPW